jgi:hypothetical protein
MSLPIASSLLRRSAFVSLLVLVCCQVTQTKAAPPAPGHIAAEGPHAQSAASAQSTRTNRDRVTVSLSVTRSDKGLLVRYRVRNGKARPILIYNRNWKTIPDPNYVSTGSIFIDDERRKQVQVATDSKPAQLIDGRKLVLWIGETPECPGLRTHCFPQPPHATKIAPSASFEDEFTIAIPVDASDRFCAKWEGPDAPPPAKVPLEPAQADNVELFVRYEDSGDVKTSPSALFPGAFRVAATGTDTPVARSGPAALPLDVLTQAGQDLHLPDELPARM